MILTLEPNQKIEIRFVHPGDEVVGPPTSDGAITVTFDDVAKRIRVQAGEADCMGRMGVIYSKTYADPNRGAADLSDRSRAILRRVISVTCDHLGCPEEIVHMDAGFMDYLGADSLDRAELVHAFEIEFDVHIPDEDVDAIVTIGDAVEYLTRRT